MKRRVITKGASRDYPTLDAPEVYITPVDTLFLVSQVFSNGTQFLNDLHGTANAQIVIKATTECQTIFRGGTEAIHLPGCAYFFLEDLIYW